SVCGHRGPPRPDLERVDATSCVYHTNRKIRASRIIRRSGRGPANTPRHAKPASAARGCGGGSSAGGTVRERRGNGARARLTGTRPAAGPGGAGAGLADRAAGPPRQRGAAPPAIAEAPGEVLPASAEHDLHDE